jgi:hypothetical protein
MVGHNVLVRGIGFDGTPQPQPVLLGMRDTDFPDRLFADLGRKSSDRLSTAKVMARADDGYLHLLQPVQRTLQLAMIDLACDTVGQPRLDPQRIESAGVVIRRISQTSHQTGKNQERKNRHDLTPEAWMRSADGKFAWVPLQKGQDQLDPDPSRRPKLRSGQAELDTLLSAHILASAMTEVFTPAFVAPPEVCERLSQTLVFAVVPTASSDVADQPPGPLDYSDNTLKQLMPSLLKAGTHQVPFRNTSVDHRYMSADFSAAINPADSKILINLMQVVALAFGAFESTPEAQGILQALNRRNVIFHDKNTMKVGDFLAKANRYLLDYDPETNTPSGQMPMPDTWETSTTEDAAAVLQAVEKSVRARSAKVLMPEGRFQDHTRLYRLRIFLRLKPEGNCPPQTLWSDYSEPFEIAPWYESAGLLGPPVPMPNPTRKFLKSVKPNVSFVVPDSLMSVIQGSSMKGIASSGGLGITWICSFSIPIITICAFFVLNLFLIVLNLVFFWLPFVKICIPIPTPAASSQGGE